MKRSTAAATLFDSVGLCLVTYVHVVKANEFDLGYFLISSAPYLIGIAILLMRLPQAAIGALLFPLLLEIGAYYSVFVSPKSSTASLIYAVLPFLNLGLFVPIGGGIGWWIGKRFRANERGNRLIELTQKSSN
jgi:hypothetical protein